MNLKRAKRIRRILKGKNSDWRHTLYVDSPLAKEKPHQKMYPITYGKKTEYIPIKVGTVRLGSCGKQVYKRAKRIAQTF